MAQFHVHHVQVIIHFQLVEQHHVHHNDQAVHLNVLECQDHVQVQFVQDLQHVHQDLVHQPVQVFLHALERHQLVHQHLHINQMQSEHQQVVHNVQVAVVNHNVAVQAEHLERMQARSQDVNLNREKHCAMNSTICKHHNLVEQLFHTVMVRLLFVCVVVLHWQTLQTRSMPIQQH